MQETTAVTVSDISHQFKTQQDEEVVNNKYLFRAVLHEIVFFVRVNSALRGGDEKSGRLEVPQNELYRSTSHKAICALHCRNVACSHLGCPSRAAYLGGLGLIRTSP